MSTFKLEYFDVRYYAETARLILHYSGQKFDDAKVDNDSWPKRKPTTPFGTVPVLTVDGNVEIGQSMAIYHYLGRKFNLTGKDELEIAQVNALGDYQKELMVSTLDFVHAVFANNPDLEKIKQENFIPNLNKFWPTLVTHLKKSKSGFFVNSGLTWVDFFVAEFFDSSSKFVPEVAEKYHELQEHSKKVHGLPQLQDYLKNRPKTQW